MIRAKITAKSNSSGRWLYEWTEQSAKITDGSDVALPAARIGTYATAPACEVNDHEVSVGAYVWLQPRGFVKNVLWYEFQYEPSSTSSPSFVEARVVQTQIAADSPTVYTVASITLPSAGTWFVYATVSVSAQVNAVTGIIPGRCVMYITGGASDGNNKGTYVWQWNQTGQGWIGQGADHFIEVTTGTPTLELRVYREATGVTWNTGTPLVLGYSSSGNQGRLGAFKVK